MVVSICLFAIVFVFYSNIEPKKTENKFYCGTSDNTIEINQNKFKQNSIFVFGKDTINGNPNNGRTIYKANCARCHYITNQKMVGPGLANLNSRWKSKKNLYSFISDSRAFIKTGDKYANSLYTEYNKSIMPAFNLSDTEINDILAYIGKTNY